MQLFTRIFAIIVVGFFLDPIQAWSQPGDECSTAISVSLNDPLANPCSFVILSGSGYSMPSFNSNTFSGLNPGCGFGVSNSDFWIRTQIPTNSDGIKISMGNPSGSSNDFSNLGVALYTGTSCSSLSYVSCRRGNSINIYQWFVGLSPSENVWLRFYKTNTTAGVFTDQFRIFLAATNTLGSNDACANAAPTTFGTYCNYTSTSRNEPSTKTPRSLSGISTICGGGAFNTFENNQWYFIEVDSTTPQPFNIRLTGVSCVGGSPVLQTAIWKSNTLSCSSWGSGYDLNNVTAAGEGFLIACAVGTGSVQISKTLPSGKYWFTADGGSGSFCTYTLTASPGVLSVSFLDFTLDQSGSQPHLKWVFSRSRDIDHFIIQSSTDGKIFQDIDKVSNFQTGVATYQYLAGVSKPMEKVYFRIQAVDKKGDVENSKVVTSNSFTKKSILVQYTPDRNQWLFNNPFGSIDVDWQLFSNEGNLIESRALSLAPGLNYFSSQIPSGLYLYQLSTGVESQMGKLVVSKIQP